MRTNLAVNMLGGSLKKDGGDTSFRKIPVTYPSMLKHSDN